MRDVIVRVTNVFQRGVDRGGRNAPIVQQRTNVMRAAFWIVLAREFFDLEEPERSCEPDHSAPLGAGTCRRRSFLVNNRIIE